MSAFDNSKFPTLFTDRFNTEGLAAAISGIDRAALHKEYEKLIRCAPSRSARGKRYFVGHTGVLTNSQSSNRFEEHLAIALWSLRRDWPRPGGGRTRLLDYQFPLKSTQQDQIGKIDLVGVTNGRLVVIELKIKRENGNDDTPVKALMEGLRYAAVAHANRSAIAAEAKARFGVAISDDPPIVQLLAPKAWWSGWTTGMANSTRIAAGDWEPAFAELIQDINQQLGVRVECLALTDVRPADIDYGPDRNRPRLLHVPSLHPVTGRTLRIGEALPPHRSGDNR